MCKLETILFASAVLSTLAKLAMAFVIPPTVPVKVGLLVGAFKFNAVCVKLETVLFEYFRVREVCIL